MESPWSRMLGLSNSGFRSWTGLLVATKGWGSERRTEGHKKCELPMPPASHLSPDRSVRQKLTQRCPGVKGHGGRGGGSLEATHHFLKRGFLRSSEAKKLAHKGPSSLQNMRKSSKEKFASTFAYIYIYTYIVYRLNSQKGP